MTIKVRDRQGRICIDHPDEAHNFEFVGAIDGGGAPAVLIELARVIQAHWTA